MRRELFLYILLILLCACSGENKIKIENISTSAQKITVQRNESTVPVLEIRYEGSRDGLSLFTRFIDNSLLCFYKYLGSKEPEVTYHIPYDPDYYRLFYSIGLHLLSGWKNDLLKYGIIEMEWRTLMTGEEALKSESGRYFRISDIDNVIQKYELRPEDERMINTYVIYFLLKEISFVSIQEFLSRPDRYFNQGDLDSIFTRMTVIPESEEFARYVLKKFGRTGLLRVASVEFSNNAWLSLTDEKINETEGSFSRNVENFKFSGVFTNGAFTNELFGELKLYNKTAKKILFRK